MVIKMKALIISDIHYADMALNDVLKANADAEHVLFLGDGLRCIEKESFKYPTVGFISVKGNCDLGYSDVPLSRTVELYGVRIFMCHGHGYSVKSGLSVLTAVARSERADIALYGHTHRPSRGEFIIGEGKKGVLFNPGSLGSPRGGERASYGILEITKDGGEMRFNIRHVSL